VQRTLLSQGVLVWPWQEGALLDAKPWPEFPATAKYTDVPLSDPDHPFVEAVIAWGKFDPQRPIIDGAFRAARLSLSPFAMRSPNHRSSPILFLISFLTAFTATLPAQSDPLAGLPRRSGLVVAGHAWTFKDGTLVEALEKTKAAGGDALEVFLMGMKLSPLTGDVLFEENLSDDFLELVKRKQQETGVRIVNAYIGSKQWTAIEQDEAKLRKIFDFGKKLGLAGFTGEPAERQWDLVEKLIREYGFTFSIHNHIRGFEAPYIGGEYRYWDPNWTYDQLEAQKRDSRFGICFDTGHYLRSGGDAVATLRRIAPSVVSLHFKDVVAIDPDGHDVPLGTGVGKASEFFEVLKGVSLRGHVAVEYEFFKSRTFAEDVRRSFAFFGNLK
jgi:sugar phosphate isomerase/epimerase